MISPAQARHENHDIRPFKVLWINVLWQAVRDVVGYADAVRPTPVSIRNDAANWFLGTEDYVGSFEWVCWVLRLDPGRVRERIASMVREAREPGFVMPRIVPTMD